MTEKRLTLEKNEIIEYIEIVKDGVVLFFEDGHSQKFNGEEFVEMINNLSFELKECRETKLFSRRQLEQENEQLKQQNKKWREKYFTIGEMFSKQVDIIDEVNNILAEADKMDKEELINKIDKELNND